MYLYYVSTCLACLLTFPTLRRVDSLGQEQYSNTGEGTAKTRETQHAHQLELRKLRYRELPSRLRVGAAQNTNIKPVNRTVQDRAADTSVMTAAQGSQAPRALCGECCLGTAECYDSPDTVCHNLIRLLR